jgi:hypothetical protein
MNLLPISSVNSYLAHKQHLLPASHRSGVVPVTRDIVALHATEAIVPYFSLWARMPAFQRQELEDALYERRELAKVLCMRATLHAVPSDELPLFFQAYVERHTRAEFWDWGSLLVPAGICQEEKVAALLKQLHRRVLDVLAQKGPSTAREIGQAVPELEAKVRYGLGKPYEGELSIGSRLVPSMCTLGLLIRTRPRGTWRSNLYEYAALRDWLPDVDLQSVTPSEAQAWLVRRYLAAFGPATFDDVQWWTGFAAGETAKALRTLKPAVMDVAIEGLGGGYLLLADDAPRLNDFAPPDVPSVFFLPGLDPYIMGYHDRRRFLAPEHHSKVFDRAGNALPTVWVNGRVVGAWGQRQARGEAQRTNGGVIYGLFAPVGEAEQALLAGEAQRLGDFLGGEFLPPRTHTPFTRALTER